AGGGLPGAAVPAGLLPGAGPTGAGGARAVAAGRGSAGGQARVRHGDRTAQPGRVPGAVRRAGCLRGTGAVLWRGAAASADRRPRAGHRGPGPAGPAASAGLSAEVLHRSAAAAPQRRRAGRAWRAGAARAGVWRGTDPGVAGARGVGRCLGVGGRRFSARREGVNRSRARWPTQALTTLRSVCRLAPSRSRIRRTRTTLSALRLVLRRAGRAVGVFPAAVAVGTDVPGCFSPAATGLP